MLDFQGSGLSPRPKMENPCNVPTTDQNRALIPYQLSAPCSPDYPLPLVNSQSDWNELDTIVDFIRDLNGVDKVHLISWSAGSFRSGPFAVQHPEKVASLFLLAPIYNPAFRSGTGSDGFSPPDDFSPPAKLPPGTPRTPMTLTTKADYLALWNAETRCEGQLEEGTQDLVWNAIMANDPIGREWGPPPAGAPPDSDPEGVMRVRTQFFWAWNQGVAARITVPVLIISGEFDRGDGGIQALPELYQTVQSTKKLRFKVQCAGHRMPWESQRTLLHEISKAWIKDGVVVGFDTGEFFVDTEGHLFPM
jgi:pimeloyl-ACP methyl ester carboxylesterase